MASPDDWFRLLSTPQRQDKAETQDPSEASQACVATKASLEPLPQISLFEAQSTAYLGLRWNQSSYLGLGFRGSYGLPSILPSEPSPWLCAPDERCSVYNILSPMSPYKADIARHTDTGPCQGCALSFLASYVTGKPRPLSLFCSWLLFGRGQRQPH